MLDAVSDLALVRAELDPLLDEMEAGTRAADDPFAHQVMAFAARLAANTHAIRADGHELPGGRVVQTPEGSLLLLPYDNARKVLAGDTHSAEHEIVHADREMFAIAGVLGIPFEELCAERGAGSFQEYQDLFLRFRDLSVVVGDDIGAIVDGHPAAGDAAALYVRLAVGSSESAGLGLQGGWRRWLCLPAAAWSGTGCRGK